MPSHPARFAPTLAPPRTIPLAALLLACAACGSGGSSGAIRPAKASPGSPIAAPSARQVDALGGTLSSPDGRITVQIPAGAISQPTSFSVQEITNTAPHGIGSAYRLEPSGTRFAVPIAITFRADPSAAMGIQSVWYQDASGYWVPAGALLQNLGSRLVTTTSSHFSDWALVASDPTMNMAGNFTVSSTLNVSYPFTANGTASLAYVGVDTVERVYLLSGSATLQPVTTSTGGTCVDTATKNLIPNVAEAFLNPASLSWGGSATWSCGAAPDFLEMVFDTAGISHLGCSRGYTVGAPAAVTTQDQAQGDYTIDCSAAASAPSLGKLRVVWNFLRCGGTCTTTDPCATAAAYTCASGTPVCTDTTFAAAGTACTTTSSTAGVCSGSSGACVACTQGAACTSSNVCAATATIDCSTGAPVCKDQTFLAAGTACTSGATTGVCSPAGACTACAAGTACTSGNACATSSTISCTSGGPVCTDVAFQPDGTGCATVSGGVCLAGSCQACVSGASCVPANPCDVGTVSCGDPAAVPPTTSTCVDTGVPITCPVGQVCTAGKCA
ncbi:MAG TPA: hypothetical protein VFE30_11870 [Anaeromyxobacteraceae bacterium]|jgi:hypothetical protein|nr:hypothetical protein [Anaeromyxobacteraceae bacterium]